eukprot:1136373-Pelagomonas_calceolata.AAC.5
MDSKEVREEVKPVEAPTELHAVEATAAAKPAAAAVAATAVERGAAEGAAVKSQDWGAGYWKTRQQDILSLPWAGGSSSPSRPTLRHFRPIRNN